MSEGQTIKDRGHASLDAFFRDWLRRTICARGVDRAVLCARLTEQLGRLISPAMLNTWTADTKRDWHIPADALPPLCEILNDYTPLRQLLNREQREALELGEAGNRLYRLLGKRIARSLRTKEKAKRKRAGKR